MSIFAEKLAKKMTLMRFHRNADGVKNGGGRSVSLRVCITTKDTENLLEKLPVLLPFIPAKPSMHPNPLLRSGKKQSTLK